MQETLYTPLHPATYELQPDVFERPAVVPAFEAGSVVMTVSVESLESFVRPPEAQVRQAAEEQWTATSPFNAENASYFGGELERMEAAEIVTDIADQARLTGKFLDGRHKILARKFDAGEITKLEHDNAVGSILSGFALTNPAHLRNVGEAQAKVIARRVKAGVLPEDTKFVPLTSRITENGVELAGIDKITASINGVNSQAELASLGLEMKAKHYRPENMVKATARHQAHQEKMFRAALAAAEAEHRFVIDLLDREEAKNKSDKKEDAYSLAA